MTFDDENLPIPPDMSWWHASVAFPDPHTDAARALATALAGRRFHFLRKDAGVRLRTEQPATDLLDQLVADRVITGWTAGIYEPETHAFGGPEGMEVAHDVFCADSPAALAETGTPGARERSVMLLSAMIREAGLDPFEAGDVYARWAALRPPVTPPQGTALEQAISAMRRLMNTDAALRPDAEAGWGERVAAFEDAGRRLRRLAADGRLIRGLRAVLAHHAIFAFNRAGVPAETQAATAWPGRHVAFSTREGDDVSTHTSASADPSLPRMETPVTPVTDPAGLRESLAQRLVDSGHLCSQGAIDAFRTTDRHQFLPGVALEAAYKEDAVPIKHDESGEMISCISAPSIVATQLEQLGAQPGHKVLEAGAATGYNAALLGKIVSPGGQVWTLDVDQDLVAGASKNLAQAGIDNATATLADGAAGLPEHAPYDRIIFTVGAGDVPVPRPARARRSPGPADAHPRQHLPQLRLRARRGHVEDRLLRDGHLHPAAQGRLRRRVHPRADGWRGPRAPGDLQRTGRGPPRPALRPRPAADQALHRGEVPAGLRVGVALPVPGLRAPQRPLPASGPTPRVHPALQLGLHGRTRRQLPGLPDHP
jgi:protein-L-isoaspartate(D-aspartate) O-methyltransferase